MTNPRVRIAAIAGSMALALSIAATPAMAQDDPAAYPSDDPRATIQGFMDAVEAKDFDGLPNYFCEEEAGQAAQFDMSAAMGELPEGLDVQSMIDAFMFDIDLESMAVLSQDEAEAVVEVAGTMSMSIDPAPLVPFIEALLAEMGMEADEATVDMFMGMMMAEFEDMTEDMSGEVTLTPGEEMPWLICSDLDFDGDDPLAEEDPSGVDTPGTDTTESD